MATTVNKDHDAMQKSKIYATVLPTTCISTGAVPHTTDVTFLTFLRTERKQTLEWRTGARLANHDSIRINSAQ